METIVQSIEKNIVWNFLDSFQNVYIKYVREKYEAFIFLSKKNQI